MKRVRSSLLAVGTALLATASAAVLAGSGAAVAAGGGGSTPPWYPISPAPFGSITFYNAQGQVITGGSITDDGLGAFAVASTPSPDPVDYSEAALYAYTPVSGQNPLTWSGNILGTATNWPDTSFPGVIGQTANPVAQNVGDETLAAYISSFPNTSTVSGYAGMYDIRMRESGFGVGTGPNFWDTVIQVHITGGTPTNPTAGTWSVDYPDWTQNTTTALTASPPSPQTPPASPVTLTATVAPATAGLVTFWSGTTEVGTPQAVTSSNGVATVMTTPPTGTTPYQAVFTPNVGSADIGSASSTLNYVVAVPQTKTTTVLTANPTTTVQQGQSVMLTATTSAADSTFPAGSVQFFQGSTSLGTQAVNSSGVAILSTTSLLPSAPMGTSLSATFTPTSSSYSSSTGTIPTYTVNPVAAKPTLSGKHQVGQTENCIEPLDPGVLADYTWFAGTTSIGTSASLKVPASAFNQQLTCQVVVWDGSGPFSSPATSNPVTVVAGNPPTSVKHHGPSLSGKAKVGKTLKVNPGKWSLSGVHFTYQWLLNGRVIRHATKSSFKLTSKDNHKKISCRVTAHLTGYANGSATTPSEKVS